LDGGKNMLKSGSVLASNSSLYDQLFDIFKKG